MSKCDCQKCKKCKSKVILDDIKRLMRHLKDMAKIMAEWHEDKEVETTVVEIEKEIIELIEIELDHYNDCTKCADCKKLKKIKDVLQKGKLLKRLLSTSLMHQPELIKEISDQVKKIIAS